VSGPLWGGDQYWIETFGWTLAVFKCEVSFNEPVRRKLLRFILGKRDHKIKLVKSTAHPLE
jgi:hypothetical protein